MNARQEAKRLFQEEHLSPITIAERLGVNPATIRKWKQRDRWDSVTPVTETVTPQPTQPVEMQILLTDAQELFCQLYVRTFNASIAYQKSHPESSYQSSMVSGWNALRNPKLRERIQQLKEAKYASIIIGTDDLVEKHMRIAFADISNYVTWGFDGRDNQMTATPSEMVDGAMVKSVSKTDKGFKIELHDPQKSLEWLATYFLMNPMDQHKVAFDNKRLEIEEKKLKGEGDTGDDHVVIDYGD